MPGYLVSYEAREEEADLSTSVDYLKGNLFQKITVEIKVRFETWFNCASPDGEVTFADNTMLTPDWIYDPSGRFIDFAVGDELSITNAEDGGNDSDQGGGLNRSGLIISEKISDYRIRCVDEDGDSVSFTANPDDIEAVFKLVQYPTGISLDYGLPENDGATVFTSPIDGELMRFSFGESSAPWGSTSQTLIPQGKESWHLGDCTVVDTTTSTQLEGFQYNYTITQVLFIHPFYLTHQIFDWSTFPNVIAPNYFDKTKCLKQVFRIRGYRDLVDPNVFQELIFDKKEGNTGWKDEQYNGGISEFTATGATYGNASTVNSLTRDDVVSVSFTINQVNTGISTQFPKYVCVNFILHPEIDSDYKNINSTVLENYSWDRAFVTESGPTINGENNGTGFQVITSAAPTSTLTSTTITFNVDFGTDAKAKIDSLSQKNYSIWAYAGSESLTAETANYTTFLIDYGSIKIDIPDSTATTTSKILFHDQQDATIESQSPKIKVEDEISVDTLVMLDQPSKLPDAQIDSVKLQLVAINSSDNEELVLQSENIDLTGEPLIGNVRFINQTTPTNFQVNASEIRANNTAFRSPTDDAGTAFAYKFMHTFLMRWADWDQLLISTYPADFQDTTQNYNGYNNNWIRLAAFSDWAINYRVQTNLSSGVTTHTVNNDTVLIDKDYEADSAQWPTLALNTFDGTTALTHSSAPYILSNKQTKVQAVFTNTASSPSFNESDVFMVARIIPKGDGNFENNSSFSSVYDRQSVSIFDSNGGNGKISITKVGNVFTGTFYIDHNKLPLGVLEYTISVSINRNTQNTALTDWGEIFKTDVLALETIVDSPVIDLQSNPFKVCCLPLNVLASVSDTNTFINDYNNFIEIFPVQYTVSMYIQKYNESTAAWDNIGSALGNDLSVTRNNMTYYAHKIVWKTYLNFATYGGEGKYRMDWDYGTGHKYSNEYCLKTYTQARADETVRIEYTLNSVIGDKLQTVTTDFVGLNFTSQIRLSDALFNDRAAPFEVEGVRMSNGRERTISKGFRETYKLELRRSSRDLFDLLMYVVLMADDLKICDYNRANNDDFVNVLVEVNGEFAPDNSNSRPYPSGSIDFISRYSNNKKFYS